MSEQSVRLLLNGDTEGHLERLHELITKAKRLECVVAFAKVSGLSRISVALIAALKRGLRARFTAGLSFYQTEPEFLQALLKLSKKYENLEVFMGAMPETFHPKIYAFDTGRTHTLIIGSANLTAGGLSGNYEASAEIKDAGGGLMKEVVAHVDELIGSQLLKAATQPRIDDYARKFEINKIHQAVARKRAIKAMANTGFDSETLRAALDALRDDKTDKGFEAKVALRRERRRQANLVMKQLIQSPPSSKAAFLQGYESLIAQFSSGGLQRGKTRIANNYQHFLAALRTAQELKQAAPEVAYDMLVGYFADIDRAGVNVLTEILLALNSDRFANMNKNAVSGMARANITKFPERPLKSNVDAATYAEYCDEAGKLRDHLGLVDFIELDTLFNHLYWN